MFAGLIGVAGATAAAGMAAVGPAPADSGRISLTIYNSDLALVQEQRVVQLTPGRNRLELQNISASIRPETVAFTAPGMSIVEQNFDYDLLTPAKLMEKAVGQQVQIVRTNPGNGQQVTETATVLSANGGVVLRIGDRIEVLRDDGAPTRVIFPKTPEGLRPRPTLSVTVDAAGGGARTATLSYLTTGLTWNADYVATFDEKAGKLDMQGWITLKNTSGTGFANADTQLIAGDINLTNNSQPWQNQYQQEQYRSSLRMGGSEAGARPPLADYYLYPLKERTTVADNQTKQVGFLSAEGVSARKAYQFRMSQFTSMEQPQHADVVVDFANSTRTGLGAQMPAGTVRVYVKDAGGQAKFVGEDRIAHTPQGSELSVKTGEAFDVTVQPTLIEQTGNPIWDRRLKMSYLLKNARSAPVIVEVRQSGLWANGKVEQESLKSRQVDAHTFLWSVPVPANGEATLTATLSDNW